jgi:D-glycero-D-manno-heptose 1,7-bisphosphate phosphatase
MNKAVFLDRDGVINKAVVIDSKPFPPASINELEIIEGVKEGIAQLKEAGYIIIVATNQPDVARGKTALQKVQEINSFLESKLSIDEVYCCYHDGPDNCHCRKPKPGMLLDAAEKYRIHLQQSFMIGDRWRDIEAGKEAGVTTILIDYNYDEKKTAPDFTAANFSEAVNYILQPQLL